MRERIDQLIKNSKFKGTIFIRPSSVVIEGHHQEVIFADPLVMAGHDPLQKGS